MKENIVKIKDHIQCMQCRRQMNVTGTAFHCEACNTTYPIQNDTLFVVSGSTEKVKDPLDKIKLLLKPCSRLYSLVIKIISPVYVDGSLTTFIQHNVESRKLYLNLGSGNFRIHPAIVNVDFIAYPNVDVCANIASIPLADECCDGIFIIGVLEHVPDPCAVIAEMHRLLKKDGFVYAFFPFIQGYHASPHDYFRTTRQGIQTLFASFQGIEIKNTGGPTSGFLWIFQEWLAMLLSFGIKPLYYFWYIVLMCITFPLKFLDIVLIHHPMSDHITSGFTLRAKK